MRLTGEALIIVAFGILSVIVILHHVTVRALINSTGNPADPAELARIMDMPYKGTLVAVPIALIGFVLIVIRLSKKRTRPVDGNINT